MANNIGPRIGIEGEAAFRKSLTDINAQLSTLGSEMRNVTSSFTDNDSAQKRLKATNEVLNKQLATQTAQVAELEKGLAAATEKFGENDSRTQKWKQAVLEAKTALNQTQKQIDESKESTDKLNGSVEKSHEGWAKLGSVLKTAGAAIGAVSVAAAGAAVALGKQVIEAVSANEQLIGGVETIFGAAGMNLEEYAKSVGKSVAEAKNEFDNLNASQQMVLQASTEAYKTAGLSANEYMETVTSFSASLIQSLDGDTQKAAKMADMALVDMADNANKMGTEMSSIQNAYQGFAKGNYTMLDNLKLGYGGTAGEMARLINDAGLLAEELPTTGQGINEAIQAAGGFGLVVEAIHTIQNELKITGTTAKEATETIEGSTKAFKATIENLMTGLGTAGADVEKLTRDVIDAGITVLDNVMPVIGQLIAAVPDAAREITAAVGETLPLLLTTCVELFEAVLETIVGLLPELIPVAFDAVMTIVDTLIDQLPNILSAAGEIVLTLVRGLSDKLPELIPTAVDAILTVVETISQNLDLVLEVALELILALSQGIIDALPRLIESLPIIIDGIVAFLIQATPQLAVASLELMMQLVYAIPKILGAEIKAIGDLIISIVDNIKLYYDEMKKAGENLIKGLWQGILDVKDWLLGKIQEIGGWIVGKIKDVFGIHSPSTVFAGLGEYMAQGLGVGFSDEMRAVSKQMTKAIPTPSVAFGNVAAGMVNGMQTAMTGLGAPQSATIVLQTSDGQTLARWLLPDLRAVMRANPEVVTA